MELTKILVVDDEEAICEILKFNLENEGFIVDVAFSAEEALNKDLEKYDLLLLDVMMGKMSGFKLADKIKKEKELQIPIIFLTAKDTENDTLTGFSLGADDYIVKPFSIRQVIARVKAILNRTGRNKTKEKNIVFGKMTIDLQKKKVIIGKKPIILTRTEFDILKLLAKSNGRILSRDEIINMVWQDDVIVGERTVDVHVTRIRKKLGKSGNAIINRFGYGYFFDQDYFT